jgi:hypothetical protein
MTSARCRPDTDICAGCSQFDRSLWPRAVSKSLVRRCCRNLPLTFGVHLHLATRPQIAKPSSRCSLFPIVLGGVTEIQSTASLRVVRMTIGIGALCERRGTIVLAADKRVQISQGRFRIDDCQKIFDLPHGFFGVTAASPDAQRLVLEICLRLSRLPKSSCGLSTVERIVR